MKQRQAERQCVKEARTKQRRKPQAAVPATPAPSAAPVPSPSSTGSASAPTAPGPPVVETTTSSEPPPLAEPPASEPLSPLVVSSYAVVAVGSTVRSSLPAPLISVTAIEVTRSLEFGTSARIEGGELVVTASAGVPAGLKRLSIEGTGCTASECGRQFDLRIAAQVYEDDVPSVAVTPDGPTSGPAGFGLQVTVPSCSYLVFTVDNGSWYAVKVPSPKETFNVRTSPILSTGPHKMTLSCSTGRITEPIWTSPGFEIDITEPTIPLGLESTTAATGGEFVFTSGPSLGSTQCPALPGVSLEELAFGLNSTPDGSLTNHRSVPMPDGRVTEGLAVPAGTVAGSYSVSDRCVYGNPAGEHASYYFGGESRAVTVTG